MARKVFGYPESRITKHPVICTKCGADSGRVFGHKRAHLCEKCLAEEKDRTPTETAADPTMSPIVRELAQRELSRKYLLPFVFRFDLNYQAGWFHRDLCRRLERFVKAVEEKRSPRLILEVPPRHGKSRLASIELPAWVLGNHPDWEFIATSYAVSLPIEFSRKIRERFRDEGFHTIFPTSQLSTDSQSAETWRTNKGGGFLAAGVSGGILGKGAHVLLVDDPFANAEEAESERIRNSVWDWFTTTAYTRLAPGGGVCIIMQRWHTDDLAGRLQTQMRDEDGEYWEVVRYPAIATDDEAYRKEGEALHSERYNLEALHRIRKALGPRAWEALYQQNPVPAESAYFTQSMIHTYETAPELLSVYNTWDLAIAQKQINDWSVGVKWGLDPEDNIYVLDVVRGRFDSLELVERILNMWVSHPDTQACGIEEGQIKLTLGPMLEKRVAERRVYSFHQIPLKPGRQDKVARARTLQGRMQQRKVFFPRDAEWTPKLVSEFLSFPFGRHDDQVDACAYMALMAADINPPSIQLPTHLDKAMSWKSKLTQFLPGGQRAKTWLSA